MTSSSSANNPPTTNPLSNSYFFYGTHPMRVPDQLTYSNSTQNIPSVSDQATHHLSLQLSNSHSGFLSASDLPTTRSLSNLVPSHIEKDDPNEVLAFIPLLRTHAHGFSLLSKAHYFSSETNLSSNCVSERQCFYCTTEL